MIKWYVEPIKNLGICIIHYTAASISQSVTRYSLRVSIDWQIGMQWETNINNNNNDHSKCQQIIEEVGWRKEVTDQLNPSLKE
jgi:hypothetical protein